MLKLSLQYELQGKNIVKIRFLKDDVSTNANFSIITVDGNSYGKLSLSKYMIRYATDRYLDIELMASTTTGLKIPVTSIIEKDFYTVPKEYLINTVSNNGGSNDSSMGFLVESLDSAKNEYSSKFVAVDIISQDDNYCYVDLGQLSVGDTLITSNSQQRYVIGQKMPLKGVYCVNTGYTVFKRIEVLDQNNEYSIVKKGLSNSISVYDHIILDGLEVDENQMIY